jgi:transposase
MESGREAAHGDVVSLLATKDAEIAALAARVTELEGLVAALHAQLGRDSSNSGKPPSSDSPFTKKPAAKRSVRTRSGKPRGKQPGAPSATLRLIDDPDDTITHTPPVCAGCGDDLADAEVFGVCRRQVFDAPAAPAAPVCHRASGAVTNLRRVRHRHRGDRTRRRDGPGPVRARSEGSGGVADVRAFPAGTPRATGTQRAAGIRGVAGWVAGLRAQAARLLETRFLPHVRALIAAAPVAHADETTARAAGSLTYLHVACTRFLTAMHVGDRSKATIDAACIWPAFTGVLVRDGYAGYEHLDKIEHAWCGIHLVRDLRAVHDPDPEGQSWAEAMVNTLLLANDTAHTARAEHRAALTDTELSTIRSRYAGAIARGRQENTHGSDPLHQQARTLLRRFQRHRDMILRFTVNLDVSFTNNTAELPARSVKVQQRSAGGCWRTLQGLIDFAVVQSYLSTATKWGINTLDAMTQLFTTGAWLPPALTPDITTAA